MKNLILLLIASTAFVSCSKDDEVFEPIEQEAEPVDPDPKDPEEPSERFVLQPGEINLS